MAMSSDWQVPPALRPRPGDYEYDLPAALAAVVGLRATIPADAFTAETLGTERAGNGVVIRRDGLVLTIGYLITEAETVWLHGGGGQMIPGHPLAYDQETGFGLIQALARVDLPALELGSSAGVSLGERVVVAGGGGLEHAVAARVVARQEFAGYWEYVLDEAIFTAPSHPNWGGTAVIGPSGELIGIGSLQMQRGRPGAEAQNLNMAVPIDILKPILNDLLTRGRPDRPPRPWLGLYATEIDDQVVVAGLDSRGPAERAEIQAGDGVLAVAGGEVTSLADFYRRVWALGPAGVTVPLTLKRDEENFDVRIASVDRSRLLKAPRLQ